MSTLALYLHALRAAQPRQLRGRALRPLNRRRFPQGEPPHPLRPVPGGAELWRSPAFAPTGPPDASTRLGRFQQQYGDDVLEAARQGDAVGAAALLAAWIDSNPPRNDDAWHPYPLSTRVGNWIAAVTLLPELATPRVSQSAWRQLLRLTPNIEEDILGNHLIRNARALVLGGAAFGATALTEQGLDLLRRELPEQVLSDGGHYERSPAYHLVVLRDLLEVQAAAPQPWLAEAIERMRRFAAALLRPNNTPAHNNDKTKNAPQLDLPAAPDGVAVFEQSGFAVVRDGPLWLAFRCGVASPGFLPPHAHADALSLQVWWRGRPVVVDPGSSTYEAGPVRDFERSTRAHSTVTVDGRDQFRAWGAFRAGPMAPVRLRSSDPLEAEVGLHDGIRHIRRVTWDREHGEVTVEDVVEGSGRHRVAARLVWAPDAPAVEVVLSDGLERRDEPAVVAERIGHPAPTRATVAFTESELPTTLSVQIRGLE